MLKLEDIEFSYQENKIFEKFDLEIQKGDFLMILGKNGSGKSTLLKLIFGIEKKKSGKIYFHGKDLDEDIYYGRERMALVFQNPDEQIVSHKVENELAFAMENYGIAPDEMRKRIDDALEITGLSHKKTSEIQTLSGGEKQRLCIASAMVMKPEILVLDEPTSMLDSKNRLRIMGILGEINRMGTAVVIVSHHLKELEYCRKVISLEKGEIIFRGDKIEFIKDLLIQREKYSLSLPSSFQLARELYQNYSIDITEEIFNLEKAGEKIWDSL
ncbi:MAG: energy-coupling factor ABC transporter ATP-binding protein [Fusobacteriaceae bacterium]